MYQVVLKTILIILIAGCQNSLYSQLTFQGKIFTSESRDKIEFHNNDSCTITFYDGILPIPWRGYAKYSIKNNLVRISFQESNFVDTSHVDIVNSISSENTIAKICVIVPVNFFRINLLEIGVLRNNFVLTEEIYKDSTYFLLNNLDTLRSVDKIFVNSVGYDQVCFPIRSNTETLYNVYLYPYKNIIRSGTLIYRVKNNGDFLALKFKKACNIDKAFIERLIGRNMLKEN